MRGGGESSFLFHLLLLVHFLHLCATGGMVYFVLSVSLDKYYGCFLVCFFSGDCISPIHRWVKF